MSRQDFHIKLMDGWQRDFPLTEQPFLVLAQEAGLSEKAVLSALRQMQEEGVLTRIGAVVRPNTVGVSTLAAMKVPASQLIDVANIVSGEPGVNHNYEREHEFNLWFVATANDKTSIEEMLARIQVRTGIEVLSLPLQKAHHIDLGFSLVHALVPPHSDGLSASPHLGHGRREGVLPPPTIEICEEDRQLLAAIEDGLTLVSRPYALVARQLGIGENDVMARLKRMVDGLVISRFGLVVRHRKIGYTANAMAVWDIDDAHVDALGDLLASKPYVTLCYQRRRARPDWPYNLFCMIHGNERPGVLKQVEELNELVAGHAARHTVLFSKNCFKQRGARFSSPRSAPAKQDELPVELSHAG